MTDSFYTKFYTLVAFCESIFALQMGNFSRFFRCALCGLLRCGGVGGHFGVELEEFFEALGVVLEAAAEVDALQGLVVALVGGAEVGGHFFRVVEVGDGRREMRLQRQQDALRAMK